MGVPVFHDGVAQIVEGSPLDADLDHPPIVAGLQVVAVMKARDCPLRNGEGAEIEVLVRDVGEILGKEGMGGGMGTGGRQVPRVVSLVGGNPPVLRARFEVVLEEGRAGRMKVDRIGGSIGDGLPGDRDLLAR